MQQSIYEFRDYKTFLTEWIYNQPFRGRGLKKALALSIGTQTGFVTHVMSGKAHFSLDQAFMAARFMKLDPDAQEYFELLVSYARASKLLYKKKLEDRLESHILRFHSLSGRLKTSHAMPDVDNEKYFSAWIYAAVHVLATCEHYQKKPNDMAKALGLSDEVVKEAVSFLLKASLIERTGHVLKAKKSTFHLASDSPYLRAHYRNWNTLALEKVWLSRPKDLHYASVFALSKSDVQVVRETLLKAVEQVKSIIHTSPGEKVYSATINFFELTR